jgi:single-strand DNA-binding protein
MTTSENQITLTGNLTKDPELRYTQTGVAVASLSMAVNRRRFNKDTKEWDEELDGFFDLNIWRDHAENVAESLSKGDRIVVIGRLRKRSWEDKDGVTRWQVEIEADEICPSLKWATAKPVKTRGGSGGKPAAPAQRGPEPPTAEDVPF